MSKIHPLRFLQYKKQDFLYSVQNTDFTVHLIAFSFLLDSDMYNI